MNDLENKRPIFSISVVKTKTDVTARQIRYYEEKKLIFPLKTKGNQRIFSKLDVEILLKIKELLKEGYNSETLKEQLKIMYPDYYTVKERGEDDIEKRMAEIERIKDRGNFYSLENMYNLNERRYK